MSGALQRRLNWSLSRTHAPAAVAERATYGSKDHEEELRQLDEVSRLPAEYPGWMLGMWSGARVKQLQDARS